MWIMPSAVVGSKRRRRYHATSLPISSSKFLTCWILVKVSCGVTRGYYLCWFRTIKAFICLQCGVVPLKGASENRLPMCVLVCELDMTLRLEQRLAWTALLFFTKTGCRLYTRSTPRFVRSCIWIPSVCRVFIWNEAIIGIHVNTFRLVEDLHH